MLKSLGLFSVGNRDLAGGLSKSVQVYEGLWYGDW